MWVAVCKNKKEHISGKVNAVCAPCIENMVIIEDPPFDIKKNVYTYKPKKRRNRNNSNQ